MKVAHIITGLETGGAEASLFKLIKYFPDKAVEHFVCSLSGLGSFGKKLTDLGVSVHPIGGNSFRILRDTPDFVRRYNPNVIQSWMYHGNLAATYLRMIRCTKAPLVWNIRQTLSSLQHEKLGTAIAIRASARLSRLPRRIIYNSALASRQHEAVGFSGLKSIVINNGFDTDIFKPDLNARLKIRLEMGIGNDVPLVGCIGREHPMKDHQSFLQAAVKVKDVYPRARFLLVGRNTDGYDIRHATHCLGLSECLKILGERDDIPAVMSALDVFVLSSAWGEAFPNVVGEAMSCGVPCVVTNIGESRHIIGDTGIVVPAGEPSSIVRAVVELLSRSDICEYGMRARERIVNEFSISAMSREYCLLYRKLLEQEIKREAMA